MDGTSTLFLLTFFTLIDCYCSEIQLKDRTNNCYHSVAQTMRCFASMCYRSPSCSQVNDRSLKVAIRERNRQELCRLLSSNMNCLQQALEACDEEGVNSDRSDRQAIENLTTEYQQMRQKYQQTCPSYHAERSIQDEDQTTQSQDENNAVQISSNTATKLISSAFVIILQQVLF